MNSKDRTTDPEWIAAKTAWIIMSRADLDLLDSLFEGSHVAEAPAVFRPLHDMAGLAPVFGHQSIGRHARELADRMRGRSGLLSEAEITEFRSEVRRLRIRFEAETDAQTIE